MTPALPPAEDTLGPLGGRRVRFLELLGQGGFGAVYRAELRGDNGLVQHVAVKVLSRDMSAQEDLAARQRDEARLLARLRHHAIVTVFDLTELGGRPAVLMELVEGVDASELRSAAVLTPRAAMQVVAETAGALDAAWATVDPDTGRPLRVVHRDIKPANLLVSRHGGVKVLDFGVARAEFDREGVTGSVQFGTARYMAPEQWLSGTASHPVDVYALGVSLVELLTGEALARAPLQPERFRDHIDAAAAAAEAAAGGTPGVARLVTGMLAYSPDARLTAAQVREAALTLADNLPGEQLARLAPKVVPACMDARRARLAGRQLPGSLPLGEAASEAPAPIDPAAPPALPTHLHGAQAVRPQTPSERHRTLPPDDSGLTMAISAHHSDAAEGPPRSRGPWLVGAAVAGLLALVGGAAMLWGDGTGPAEASGRAAPETTTAPGPADPAAAMPDVAPSTVAETPDARDATAAAAPVAAEPTAADAPADPPPARPTAPRSAARDRGSTRPAAAATTPPPDASSPEPETPSAEPEAPAPEAAPAAAASEEASTGAAPAPAALFAVTLSSDPLGARVWVDGEDLGTTPVVGASLAEGNHSVRMELGDAAIDGTIRVRRMRPVSEVKWRVESGRLSMQ